MTEVYHGSTPANWYVNTGLKRDGVRVSESVTEGHPDKVMDCVADAILDDILMQAHTTRQTLQDEGNPDWMLVRPDQARVAIEGLAKGSLDGQYPGGILVLAGEVTAPHLVQPRYEEVARRVIQEIGYDDPDAGFSHALDHFFMNVTTQSADIAAGVGEATGAGDQGILFGYATVEDPSLMPLPIQIAHNLTQALTEARKNGAMPWLKPDGKSQVGIKYENGQPVEVTNVTLAAAHGKDISLSDVRWQLYHDIIVPVLDQYHFGVNMNEKALLEGSGSVIINGAGRWDSAWGPLADAGVVGRKLDVDTYGGAVPHGGGALSGKDPTKVDRSAKYGARFVASNLVREGLADRAQVFMSYTIGQERPDNVTIDTFGTEKRATHQIRERAVQILDLTVPGIIEQLQLFDPIYAKTAHNGHFGHDFRWEQSVDGK